MILTQSDILLEIIYREWSSPPYIFTKKELDTNFLHEIYIRSNSKGKTLANTIAYYLQKFRDKGIIKFLERGRYQILQFPEEENESEIEEIEEEEIKEEESEIQEIEEEEIKEEESEIQEIEEEEIKEEESEIQEMEEEEIKEEEIESKIESEEEKEIIIRKNTPLKEIVLKYEIISLKSKLLNANLKWSEITSNYLKEIDQLRKIKPTYINFIL